MFCTRRCAHGARNRAPNGLVVVGRPGQAPARLKLEMSIAVVLEFRTQRQMHFVPNQLNFILHKSIEEMGGAFVGIERHHGSVPNIVVQEPVAGAPDYIVAIAYREAMLEIDISGVALFAEDSRIASRRVVVA